MAVNIKPPNLSRQFEVINPQRVNRLVTEPGDLLRVFYLEGS